MGTKLAKNVYVSHDGQTVALAAGTEPSPELGALVGDHAWEGGISPYPKGPKSVYDVLNVAQLRKYATDNGIALGDATRRGDIVARIQAADEQRANPAKPDTAADEAASAAAEQAEAERIEQERIDAEEAARLQAEQEAAEQAETERLAAEEAERVAAEEAAAASTNQQ